jgi:hypothetical protein
MSEAIRDFGENLPSILSASEDRLSGGFPRFDNSPASTLAGFDSPHEVLPSGNHPSSTESALGKLIHLPKPRAVDADPELSPNDEVVLPETDLDLAQVKTIFTQGDISDEERIGQLLTLAYNGGSVVESSIPPELRSCITDSPAEWYMSSKGRVEGLILDRIPILDIYDQTDKYQDTPFLRNAAKINEIAWNYQKGEVGKRAELAARLIILDADRSLKG